MSVKLNTNEPTLFDEMDFVEQIERLMNDSESSEIEFKSAKGGFPDSFWETYSSFANTQGGTIVLGVKESKGRFCIDNLSKEQVEKYKKEFWDKANNIQFVSANLLKNSDIQEGVYGDSVLLLFNIPRADRKQMPIYRTLNPFGNTYKRNHEGDYKCTNEEVKRMIADSDDSHPQDSRILNEYSMDDIDLESLKQYRQLFAISKPSHPWLALDDKSLLERLGGYRKDRQTKQEGFTLAGLLMFGKIESILDEECAPFYFPDYRECLSSNPEIRWTDRIYPDGTWEANLFQFYRKVYPKLASFLPKPFKLEQGRRIDETPTHIALREAFINTLIHCNHSVNASIVIEYSKDGFVFSNPGSLLISLAQYYRGGESVCRNKSIQKMFMQIGSAEKAGSGVDKIISGWKEANLAYPYVKEQSRPDKVVLELPLISLLSVETMGELTRLFGDDVSGIGRNELLALATACTEGETTNDRLRLVLDLHRADITKLLQALCRGNYLISHGIGRGTRYTLNKDFGDASNVASNVASKRTRLPIDILQKEILAVCADYISLEEIAKLIDKNLRYLKNNVIPTMVTNGMLEREYPHTPKHPNQRYKANKL